MEDLTTHDDGNYTCIVSNKYGQLEWTYILDVIRELNLSLLAVDLLWQAIMCKSNLTDVYIVDGNALKFVYGSKGSGHGILEW